MTEPVSSLKQRLKGDLLLAMKARDAITISALRSVLSALDNATALPSSTVAEPVMGRSGDVPRKDLLITECLGILNAEMDARSVAAEEYDRLGLGDAADRLRSERAIVERYVGTVNET